MRISDWSSDVCSSDLREPAAKHLGDLVGLPVDQLTDLVVHDRHLVVGRHELVAVGPFELEAALVVEVDPVVFVAVDLHAGAESERVERDGDGVAGPGGEAGGAPRSAERRGGKGGGRK